MTKRIRTTLIAGTVAAVAIAASPLFTGLPAAQEMHLPADVGDLSNAAAIEVKDDMGVVVLRGNFVEQPEDDDDVERKAQLIGSGATANATGSAEVEVAKRDNRLDQEVEVEVANLMPGATYSVVIDSKPLGTFQTNKDGKGNLELSTGPVTQP